jgi:hypothetical protein
LEIRSTEQTPVTLIVKILQRVEINGLELMSSVAPVMKQHRLKTPQEELD